MARDQVLHGAMRAPQPTAASPERRPVPIPKDSSASVRHCPTPAGTIMRESPPSRA